MRRKLIVRTVVWLLAVSFLVNLVAIVAPLKILIRTVDRNYVVDHDLQYDVPDYARERWGGRKVHRDKVCVYWKGATVTLPVFIAADASCTLLKLG